MFLVCKTEIVRSTKRAFKFFAFLFLYSILNFEQPILQSFGAGLYTDFTSELFFFDFMCRNDRNDRNDSHFRDNFFADSEI